MKIDGGLMKIMPLSVEKNAFFVFFIIKTKMNICSFYKDVDVLLTSIEAKINVIDTLLLRRQQFLDNCCYNTSDIDYTYSSNQPDIAHNT